MILFFIFIEKGDHFHAFICNAFRWCAATYDQLCIDTHFFQMLQCIKRNAASLALPLNCEIKQGEHGVLFFFKYVAWVRNKIHVRSKRLNKNFVFWNIVVLYCRLLGPMRRKNDERTFLQRPFFKYISFPPRE